MKIIDLATRRRVTIAMFTIAVLLFGSVSLSRLNVNLLPDLSYPTLTIRTEYEGAAPVEIENLITKPVEEVLGVVKNVKEMRSVSRPGQSDVVLEFDWGTDMDLASIEARQKLDALVLPLEADRPVLLRFDPSFDPIIRYGLFLEADEPARAQADDAAAARPVALQSADTEGDLKVLRRFADEQLKKQLESATGVAAVKVSGGLEDEVQILVDQERLAQLDLPIERVVSVIRSENVNLSGGRLEEGVQQFLVRTVNQFQSVEQIGDVIVDTGVGGRPVYLRDVAEVRLGYKEREAITRINGREAVELAVYKEGDANTVAVAEAVEARLNRFRGDFPDQVRIEKVYDQSRFIASAVSEVVDAAVIGGLLAIVILFLFLRNVAATLIIGISIPVSIVATFNMMYGYDLTLNIMSLGGLALGIGLLVDNSIVVLENVHRHREMGKNRLDAARDGASEVGRAVVASTLTTVAVFFPLVFVSGVAGQLFKDQALTVTFSLLASLVVALTLIPMLASLGGEKREAPVDGRSAPTTRFGRGRRRVADFLFRRIPGSLGRGIVVGVGAVGRGIGWLLTPITRSFTATFDAMDNRYPDLLTWALRRRALVLVSAFALFAASLLLVPRLGIELIPQFAQDEFNLEVSLAPGTPLAQTDRTLAVLQNAAISAPYVENTFAVAGSGNRMDANPDQGGENWGELHVSLTTGAGDAGEREAVDALRDVLAGLPGTTYQVSRPTLFSFRTPIEVEVAGYDLDALKAVSQDIAESMRGTGRFADVESSMEVGHPEIQILFDRDRAAALGLSVSDAADRLVSAVRGSVATRYSWNDRKIDVLVRTREEDRASVERLRQLIINPESARPLPLSAIAEIRVATGPSEIRRTSQQRVAVVSANLAFGDLGTAADEVERILAETPRPEGLSVRLAGQNEEMSNSFRSLILALLLAVFLVYLVMASQFESLLHPFVIFFSIPLALIGAIVALWITGSTVSVVVFIGLILLAGIVVNNAIVLVDLINQLRDQGQEKFAAIVEGGRQRLRPILMTTLTTTLGLLPLAIGLGDGAEIRAPMAITVIGGLLVSTALTLLVIPVMYSILDRSHA